ncbi:hypothetical protein KP509_36G035300 [Ceratopteris richardii]|uniref:Uncharacterized protein n=1 Tax=Ceratopteris richardii TaxID=49495 RepID=A0A8T2QBZ4_CERRI|nr:hypothetical protein KP509_36G035300 [Ceratopteris richardii]
MQPVIHTVCECTLEPWKTLQWSILFQCSYKPSLDRCICGIERQHSPARFPELSNPSVSPTPMSSANELFCNGQIKPLRIPVTCIEHASSSADHNKMFDHSSDPTDIHEPISGSTRTNSLAVCSLPHTMEFHNNCKTSNSSISAPQTPRFSSRSTLNVTSSGISCQLYRGKSASSVSAPQSPNTSLHRVRGALCGVSPSKMDRAFDASFLISAKASQHNAGVSSEVEKALGMSMQMPVEAVTHPLQIQKQGRDCLRRTGRSMFSFPHRSQGTGHRRTRSFSPLRIFQRNDHSQSQMVSPLEAVEQPDIQRAQESTGGGRSDEDSNVEKGSSRKWTLKDLLHRKSTGENRSNTITATSRKSEPSANSASPTEKMVEKSLSIGRSSSESSHSSTSTLSCRKEGVPSTNLCLSRSKILESKDREPSVNLHNIKKGPRNIVLDARTQSFSSSSHHYDNGKTKSSSQKSVRTYVQRGSKWDSTLSSCETQYSTHKLYAERTAISEVDSSNTKTKSTIQRGNKQKNNKECVSPHEMHYVRHKAQTEELRKRTFLPYRQGLLGCLGFTSRSYKTVSTISKTLQSVSG